MMVTKYIPLEAYQEYLEKIVEDGAVEVASESKLLFRCPICGDSKKSKSKRRGFLLSDGEHATMGCLKCGVRIPFYYYLKTEHSALYSDWIMNVYVFDKEYEKKEEEFAKETCYVDYSEFHPLTDKTAPTIRNSALHLINSRKIPKLIAKKLLYSYSGKFANRLIFPYYMRDGSFKYFEARDLGNNDIQKYKFPTALPQEYYNLNFVDKNRLFFIFEGLIDSFFIENSITSGGATKIGTLLSEIDKKYHKNAVLIFDGDIVGIRQAYKYFKKGYKVFVWNESMLKLSKDGKIDMNELVIKGFFDSVLDKSGRIPESKIMKYVMVPSIYNLLEFEMYYSRMGFELEEKLDAKFIHKRAIEPVKNNRNNRKSGVR